MPCHLKVNVLLSGVWIKGNKIQVLLSGTWIKNNQMAMTAIKTVKKLYLYIHI